MTAIRTALEAFIPQIAERYESSVTHLFTKMVEAHGASLKGIFNSWTYARAYRNHVSIYVRTVEGAKVLNTELLAAGAQAYALGSVAAWEDKINLKVGELENADVSRLDGVSFNITGMRAGKKVQIVQQIIVNVSSQGKAFNQFPARTYVERKPVSEAAYRKMFS